MSQYFFCLEHNRGPNRQLRLEQQNLDAAKREAVRMLAEMLREFPELAWESDPCRVSLADDEGLSLFVAEIFSTHAPAAR